MHNVRKVECVPLKSGKFVEYLLSTGACGFSTIPRPLYTWLGTVLWTTPGRKIVGNTWVVTLSDVPGTVQVRPLAV
jgi:hypothetical protein